jgi:four helix bundle protein
MRVKKIYIISSLCAAKTYRIFRKENISISQSENIDKRNKIMEQNKNQLREDTINFAIEVSDVFEKIKGCSVYTNQLIRSSSSIGANVHEAKYAQSKSDFIHKLEISLKESSETEYWLELLYRKNTLDTNMYRQLKNKCGSIRRRLIASITTAKSKI